MQTSDKLVILFQNHDIFYGSRIFKDTKMLWIWQISLPYLNQRGHILPTQYYQPSRIFRPCFGPGLISFRNLYTWLFVWQMFDNFFLFFLNCEYRWWRHSQFWWCWKWYSQWRLSNSKSLCGKSLTFCRIYVFKRLPTYVWCTRKASTTYSWTRKFILKLLTFHIFGVSIISILKYPVIQLFQSYSRKLKISTISIMWKSFQLTHSLFRYGSMGFVLISYVFS